MSILTGVIQGSSEKVVNVHGSLASNPEEERLMRSVLEGKEVDNGKLIRESINQGISRFNPDLIFENLVDNFRNAQKLYGKTLIREITGYNEDYLKKNLKIPEFRKILKKKIYERFKILNKEGILDKEGEITDLGYKIAALVLYMEELEDIKAGEEKKKNKITSSEGMKNEITAFSKDKRYRDIALKKSIRTAVRRNHKRLYVEDLKSYSRKKAGEREIILLLDASGSMKGKKIDSCRKAGIALAYKSFEQHDKVGLVVFSSGIQNKLKPVSDIAEILNTVARIKPSKETNIALAIATAREMFSKKAGKHIILITDALPTSTSEEDVLKEVSISSTEKITISLIGIELNDRGIKLAKRISEISNGRFYLAKKDERLDRIVLLDYYLSTNNL